MSKETNVSTNGGIGFCSLLTILFIGLKLAAIGPVANWSWLWVLSPLWIPLVIVFGILIVGFTVWGISYLIYSKFSR